MQALLQLGLQLCFVTVDGMDGEVVVLLFWQGDGEAVVWQMEELIGEDGDSIKQGVLGFDKAQMGSVHGDGLGMVFKGEEIFASHGKGEQVFFLETGSYQLNGKR